MLSWQSILRIGCQTERLAQLRAFAIIGVILLQRRSRITMPPCEYFTLFYIQCGVYTEFGIEPMSGRVLHLPDISVYYRRTFWDNFYYEFILSEKFSTASMMRSTTAPIAWKIGPRAIMRIASLQSICV